MFLLVVLSGNAQQVVLTGVYSNESLSSILNDLTNETGVNFYYKQSWVAGKVSTIDFEGEPIISGLKRLLENHQLSVIPYDDYLYIIAPGNLVTEELSLDYLEMVQTVQSQEINNDLPMISVGDSLQFGKSNQNRIRISVIDEQQATPVNGATVFFEELDISAVVDQGGRASVTLPTGIHQMEVRMVSYEPYVVNLSVLSSGTLEITMIEEIIELNEVVITEQGVRANIASPEVGLVTLTPKQIKELPVFLGEPDVIKTVLTIPGITTLGEGAPGFFVRGGNIDQNLILQDEGVAFFSSHALGFFSVFNPDLIQSVKFYKGSIPAQYGGRISSVLDVKLEGSDFKTTKIDGGVGTVVSKLAIQTPLIKDKLSLIAGGRVAYSDWLLNFVNNPEVRQSSVGFNDLNVKLSYKLGKKGIVSLGYFSTFDRVQFEDQFGFQWSSKNASLLWDQNISGRVGSEFSISAGRNRNENFDPSGVEQYQLINGQEYLRLKENIAIDLPKHRINTGVEWVYYHPGAQELISQTAQDVQESVSNNSGHDAAIYINDEWEINDKISVNAGIRLSYFGQVDADSAGAQSDPFSISRSYTNIEPRFALRYSLNDESSIKASFARLNQYIHLVSSTTAALPVDQWLMTTDNLLPQSANNYSLGYFRNFDTRYEASAEVFYRDIFNAVEVRDFADLVLNPFIENEIIQGSGRAYGLELFVKKNVGRVKGSFAYTFSRALNYLQLDNQEGWFAARIDRPHNVNIVFDLTISKKSKLAVNFVYTSGRPITAPVASYNLNSISVPHYEGRNDFRIPDYHRMDISYTIRRNAIRKRRYQDYFTFSLYNVYGRRNAFSVFFRREENRAIQAYRLSVLGSVFPSVTYRFEF